MLTTSTTGATLAVVVGTSLVLFLWRLFSLQIDSREPPLVKARVPIVGHTLGMLRESHAYWTKLYQEHQLPACTLPVLSGKVYVLNSPGLIAAGLRASTLSHDYHLKKSLGAVAPLSKQARAVLQQDEFFQAWAKAVHGSMNAASLISMETTALTYIYQQLNDLPMYVGIEDTFLWILNVFTKSTIAAVLGAKNPWKDTRALLKKYWIFEAGVQNLTTLPAPSMTSSASLQAQQDMHQALIKCDYKSRHYEADDVSALIKTSNAVQEKHGWSVEDRAAMAITTIHSAVSNTALTAYWCFMYIMSQPGLIKRLRKEVEPLTTKGQSLGNGKREVLVNIAGLEAKAPLLVAAFQETQRAASVHTVNRWVVEDTVLSDGEQTVVLKKGNAVVMPSIVNHSSTANWGRTADEFDPDRFLKAAYPVDSSAEDEEAKIKRGVFTPFGGGSSLCPGSGFALGEIGGALVVFLLGFELTDAAGGSPDPPLAETPHLAGSIGKPAKDADLRSCIRRRKGWEKIVWKVAP
ncbi:cytochrome P450 [Xylariales sp. PMI_506]|nr:cytochrome P450 [Xylariales sp. PMI_506]